MGTEIRPDEADSNTSPQRVSSTACNPRHARPSTEILDPGSGTPQGHPKTPQNPLSCSEKGRLSWVKGLIASLGHARGLTFSRVIRALVTGGRGLRTAGDADESM